MKIMQNSINKTSFHYRFYENQQVPSICPNVSFKNKALEPFENTKSNVADSKINVLTLFPNYLKLNLNKDLYTKRTVHKPGFAVDLTKGYESIEAYVETECSSSFRKNLTRWIRKLEASFDIEYKMFYGNISKEDCGFLMKKLRTYIENRFKQRSGRNSALRKWEYYSKLAYEGINNKTASLFVIYNGNLPIKISLNFHYNNLMFTSVSSYNINYSKFSLGNIHIYKELEWCIENNAALYDIGYGDYEYKRCWANYIYDFETIYISKKNSLLLQCYALFNDTKTKLIHYLISKRVNYWFHDTVDKIKGIDKTHVPKEYEVFDCKDHKHKKREIDLSLDDSFFLRKPVYHQAYLQEEHIDNFNVYKSKNDSSSYIIKSPKNTVGIKFN